jgi:hypothetical protein
LNTAPVRAKLPSKLPSRGPRARRPNAATGGPSLLELQRLAGNAAVARLVGGGDKGSRDRGEPLSAQRFPLGPFTPRGGPSSSPTPLPAGDEVVELRGAPKFVPSIMLQDHIKAQGGAPVYVKVQFGSLAEGQIPVFWNGTGFQTIDPLPNFPAWGLPFDHPAMQTASRAKPTLWIRVNNSTVSGSLGWTTPAGLAQDPAKFKARVPLEALFGGMTGFTNLRFPGAVDSRLTGGTLLYDVPQLTFDHGPFHGSGWLRLSDEDYEFEAEIDVPLTGLPGSAKVPLRRAPSDTDNPVYGTKTWAYQRTVGGKNGGQISGELTATLGRGSLDIRGDARYSSRKPKINGRVTIIVDSFDEAKQAITSRLGPDAPSAIEPAGSGETLAIAGYGQLDFAFSSWMTGNAEMILHPEGYVTARGELLPAKIVQLARRREKSKTLVDKEISRVIAGVPVIGDVRAKGRASLKVYGWFGPGTLHDIRLSGLLSNHPDIVNRFDLA